MKTKNDTLNAIQTMVDNAVRKAGYDKTRNAVVIRDNKNNTCKIKMDNIEYDNVVCYGEGRLVAGDSVKVVIPNSQASQMFVLLADMSPYILGEVRQYTGIEIPKGWAQCAGQELSKVQYRGLYDAIGDEWGDPSTHDKFKLPNFGSMPTVGSMLYIIYTGKPTELSYSYTVESAGATYEFTQCSTGTTDSYYFGMETSYSSDWYQSSNASVNSSVALSKITLNIYKTSHLTIDVVDYQNETSFDYGTLGTLNGESLSTSASVNYDTTNANVKWTGYRNHIQGGESIDYGTVGVGTYTIYARFKKDSSVTRPNDKLYFRLNIT